jgi:hypothetical protein
MDNPARDTERRKTKQKHVLVLFFFVLYLLLDRPFLIAPSVLCVVF